MALTPGTRLGVYDIIAAIGEGGMGAVYRATDTSLSRQVAIKVLPDAFAQDAERLARFEREAKTLAALNHPNIAAIYGLERSGGTLALVMELVEGDDLSERIARRRAPGATARQAGMPIDEVLPIAKQIAKALEAAHEQGIIHRNLKPANIKVRPAPRRRRPIPPADGRAARPPGPAPRRGGGSRRCGCGASVRRRGRPWQGSSSNHPMRRSSLRLAVIAS
ncbi:MAG: serine/threonine-protein kinase [Actinomycetota bacterium]